MKDKKPKKIEKDLVVSVATVYGINFKRQGL